MKKKIVFLSLVLILTLTGVVSAASLWGTYKGNEIINLKANGRPILVAKGDVPAINYQGRTMVPINLLKYAGISYTWDQKTKTVDIVNSPSEPFVSEQEFIEMNKLMQANRAFIYYMDQIDLVNVTISIVNNAVTKEQLTQAQTQVNRINIDGLNDWLIILQANEVSDSYSFEQIMNSIERAKDYLLQWDTQNAFTQFISARSSMNILHNTLDAQFDPTFGKKNIERLTQK